ncbi:MAG: 3'-5' exonuclease [Lachnospiraceae bacterium]
MKQYIDIKGCVVTYKIKESTGEKVIKDYICVDIEATGLQPKAEKIIEIGAIKVRNLEIVDTFSTFVYPGKPLTKRIIELTGITDADLENAPLVKEIIEDFHMFCEDLPLLGHNIILDYAFLKRAMVDERLTFERSGVDTLKISRKYLSELESRALGALTKHFQIEHKAHRALEDAKATHLLYKRMIESFYERDIAAGLTSFAAKPLQYQAKRQTLLTIAQKEQILRLCERDGIALERDVTLMTRSEASRWIEHRLQSSRVAKE